MLGEARRKRLAAKAAARKQGLPVEEVIRVKEDVIRMKAAEVLKLRREWDSITAPWRENMQLFANRVGPRIFPPNDTEQATQFFRRVTLVASNDQDRIGTLAAVMDPIVKAHPDILQEGLEHLRSVVKAQIEIGKLDPKDVAEPQSPTDIALLLAGIYARRMLANKSDPDYEPEAFVPFADSHDDILRDALDKNGPIAGRVLEEFFRVEKDEEQRLTGAAAEARDAFYALSKAQRDAVFELARSMHKDVHDSLVHDVGSLRDFQSIFDVCAKSPWIAGGVPMTFATARVIHREQTVTQEEMIEATRADKFDHASGVIEVSPKVWTDTELTQVGIALWEKTYKLGKGDPEVREASKAVAERWAYEHDEPGSKRSLIVEDIICFTAKWAVHAFQRITSSHTYAAALMCSDADKALLQTIEMQWSAFLVCVPNGLLSYTDSSGVKREYNRILLAKFDNGVILITLNQNGDWRGVNLLCQRGETLASVLEIDDNAIDVEDSAVQAKLSRILIMAKRFVAGILLLLQSKENYRSTTHGGKSKKGRHHEEPAHRVVEIGSALKIDCRPNVADFIEHGSSKRKGAPPSVQTLVRGHVKAQVYGKGRLGRKPIFIQPYWRGPEGAPILTRPKRVVV